MSRSLTPSRTQPSPNPEIEKGGGMGGRGRGQQRKQAQIFQDNLTQEMLESILIEPLLFITYNSSNTF